MVVAVHCWPPIKAQNILFFVFCIFCFLLFSFQFPHGVYHPLLAYPSEHRRFCNFICNFVLCLLHFAFFLILHFAFSSFYPSRFLMVVATHCWPALESTEDVIFILTFVFFCFIFYFIFLISYFSFGILHFLLFFLCRFLMVVATHCWPAHRSTEASDTLGGAASALTVFGRRPTLSHF